MHNTEATGPPLRAMDAHVAVRWWSAADTKGRGWKRGASDASLRLATSALPSTAWRPQIMVLWLGDMR